MTQLTNLTEMEKQVLTALINGLYAEAGFSDINANDLSKATEIPTKSIRGVIASLVKKGIVQVETADDWKMELIYLHKNYYGLVPKWAIEEEIEAIEIL
jgi:predicted transcriptional regulator